MRGSITPTTSMDEQLLGSQLRLQNFVDGRFVESEAERWFDKSNPATGEVFARIDEASEHDVDNAVRSAQRALRNGWPDTPVRERVGVLRRIADGIERRFDEFVEAEVRDTGKPIQTARTLDVPRAVENFRVFADIISSAGQSSFLSDGRDGKRSLNYAVRKPLGVIAVVVPWNLPLLLLTWKLAPALGCGNAVVVKPSEETPSSATLLAEVVLEAGAPTGTYNVVHGMGSGSAGQFLTEHPGVDGVTFTGSSATGIQVMRAAAVNVCPVSLELGGKNAAIVFDDADIGATVEGLTRSVFANAGQVCLCTERIYVQRGVYDEVCAGLTEQAHSLRLGDPRDPATTMGPLISHAHRRKVLQYFSLANDAGATVLTGGGIPDLGEHLAGGSWIDPTVWTGLTNADRPMREEIFGPVAAVVPFDDEQQALTLANDTDYGLASSVWTRDLSRGHRVAQRMQVGLSWVNTWFDRELRAPFGGIGRSGIGREGGEDSLHFYTEPTNVCIQL